MPLQLGGEYRLPQQHVEHPPEPVTIERLQSEQLLSALAELREALAHMPAPIINVDQPDLTAIVQAVTQIKGSATAEEIAQAVKLAISPTSPTDPDPVMAEMVEALKTLDFRLKGIGSGGGGGANAVTNTQLRAEPLVVETGQQLTPFTEVLTAERSPLFNLSSIYPLSRLRNIVTGTPTDTGEEYVLSANDKVETAEISRYIPGFAAEFGIGVRIIALPTGTQVMRWGLYDDEDGIFYELTAAGLFAVVRRDSVDTRIAQADWNGVSDSSLSLMRGTIFQVRFTWYGYGQIEFQIADTDVTAAQQIIVLHRVAPNGATSIRNPNLPITAEVTGAGSGSMALGGRQFSIVGRYEPQQRTHAMVRSGLSVPVGPTWTPVLAFRRQNNTDAKRIKLRVQGVTLSVTAETQMALVMNPTITFGTAVAPELSSLADSAVEFSVNPSGFALGTGEAVLTDIVTSSGTGGNRSGGQAWPGLNLPVARRQPVVLVARGVSGPSTVTALLRSLEEW